MRRTFVAIAASAFEPIHTTNQSVTFGEGGEDDRARNGTDRVPARLSNSSGVAQDGVVHSNGADRTITEPFETLGKALSSAYRLEREIGRGGMSVVYCAEDLRLGNKVALKVLRPELAGIVAVERFLQEIRIAADLRHPQIVPLLDSGEADGVPWYTMPFIEGASLRERLRQEKQLPIPDVIRIARDVANALTYAHERGFVHRDIKPDNILFRDGQAVVADFGIARAVERSTSDERLTASGITVGTPPYMSPEQAGGESCVDARADIYSLGCVVYEMLSGEPPFTGPTATAIRARHQLDPVPSLRTVRGTVPAALEHVIVRALAKVPADRYATPEDFATALEHPPKFDPAHPARRARAIRWAAATALLIAGGVAGRKLVWPERPALDSARVLIYPLVERGLSPADSGAGYDVALVVGAALEHTEPLKWLDGWQYLDERTRLDANLVTARTAQRIAKARGARYYVDGVVRQNADSTFVTLQLHDALGDSVAARQTEAGATAVTAPYQLALAALPRLLPRLLAADRQIDFAPLTDRRPAAIALWLQAEREYRLARFAPALRLYERAVAEDSALVFAAVKGAQAADWLTYVPQTRQLLAVALAGEQLLPPRYRDFARGLDAYLGGRADSAVAYFEKARAAAPDWQEATMALGQVHYHLLPTRTSGDSAARAAFEAAAADSQFTPPLLYLAEMAARDGDVRLGRRLLERLRSRQPDTTLFRLVSLMVDCVDQTAARFNWAEASGGNAIALLYAAKGLSMAAAQPECAETGFRAILAMPGSTSGQRWSALMGLQGVLAARGMLSELSALLDSAVASGTPQASWMYVLAEESGLAVHHQVAQLAAIARQRFGDNYERASPHWLWMLAQHSARVGDLAKMETIREALERSVAEPGARTARLLADAVAADLAVAKRDTVEALAKLRRLVVTAPGDTLTWSLWEPLAVERLKLARFLIARGEFAEAIRVASVFDHPRPMVFVSFVPASLQIRLAAAGALGDTEGASKYRRRLERLGRRDMIAGR